MSIQYVGSLNVSSVCCITSTTNNEQKLCNFGQNCSHYINVRKDKGEGETCDDGFSQKIVATLGWWLVAEKADSHSAGRRKINCFDFLSFQFFISLLWAFYSFTYSLLSKNTNLHFDPDWLSRPPTTYLVTFRTSRQSSQSKKRIIFYI